MASHEDTRSTLDAFLAETLDLVVSVNSVELQDAELDVLVLVADLLWLGVGFLLVLLLTGTEKFQGGIDGGLGLELLGDNGGVSERTSSLNKGDFSHALSHLSTEFSEGARLGDGLCDRLTGQVSNK